MICADVTHTDVNMILWKNNNHLYSIHFFCMDVRIVNELLACIFCLIFQSIESVWCENMQIRFQAILKGFPKNKKINKAYFYIMKCSVIIRIIKNPSFIT